MISSWSHKNPWRPKAGNGRARERLVPRFVTLRFHCIWKGPQQEQGFNGVRSAHPRNRPDLASQLFSPFMIVDGPAVSLHPKASASFNARNDGRKHILISDVDLFKHSSWFNRSIYFLMILKKPMFIKLPLLFFCISAFYQLLLDKFSPLSLTFSNSSLTTKPSILTSMQSRNRCICSSIFFCLASLSRHSLTSSGE